MICGIGGGELSCPADRIHNKGIEIYDTFLNDTHICSFFKFHFYIAIMVIVPVLGIQKKV